MNINIIKNITILYNFFSVAIDSLSIFFGLVFKVNMNHFQKKQVFNINISILLKYIRSKFAIVFIK